MQTTAAAQHQCIAQHDSIAQRVSIKGLPSAGTGSKKALTRGMAQGRGPMNEKLDRILNLVHEQSKLVTQLAEASRSGDSL